MRACVDHERLLVPRRDSRSCRRCDPSARDFARMFPDSRKNSETDHRIPIKGSIIDPSLALRSLFRFQVSDNQIDWIVKRVTPWNTRDAVLWARVIEPRIKINRYFLYKDTGCASVTGGVDRCINRAGILNPRSKRREGGRAARVGKWLHEAATDSRSPREERDVPEDGRKQKGRIEPSTIEFLPVANKG